MTERLVRVRITAKMAKLLGFAEREMSIDLTLEKLHWLLREVPAKGHTGLALRRRLMYAASRWDRLARVSEAARLR